MTREQAINYLFSRGFTNEQVGEVVRALTYKPRDCANCKHYVVTDTRTNWGSQETTKIYGCECWECEYEPTTKNNLGVDREEAIETLKENLCAMCAYGSQNMESCDIRSCDNRNAIKALEQEPILDKLRVEIEQNAYPIVYGINNHELGMTLYGILQVIDKYKAESEA